MKKEKKIPEKKKIPNYTPDFIAVFIIGCVIFAMCFYAMGLILMNWIK